ncbi:MAG: hypothetical protein IJ365_01060 [Clostridia bacterium]|nr:hypothetical protein [Clostridia bacterium]
MKRFLKIMCLSMIFALITTISAFASDDAAQSKYERVKQHAEYCHQSIENEKKAKMQENASLMSYSEIPDTFLSLDSDYKMIEGEVFEVYFENPSESYYFDICVQSKDTGEILDYVYADMYEIYDDDDDYIIGVEIDYVETYEMTEGEYNIYIIDSDDNYYEPFTFVCKGYEIYDTYFSNQASEVYLYYDLKTDAHYTYPWLETVTLEFKDEDGITAFKYENICPSYMEQSYMDIGTTFPSDIDDGAYDLYTTMNFCDGTKKELIPTTIYIGNYMTPSSFHVMYGNVNQNTKKIHVQMDLPFIPAANEEFSVVMVDMDGKELLRTSDYKYSQIYSDSCCMNFFLDMPQNLTVGEYEIILEYSGDKIYEEPYSDYIWVTSSVRMCELAKISPDKIELYIEGIPAGTYNVYEQDSYQYVKGDFIGQMNVDADSRAVLNIECGDEDYSYYDYVYVCPVNDDGTKYTFFINISDYYDSKTIQCINNVKPGFIAAGITDITNMQIDIDYYGFLDAQQIKSIQLEYNGEVVATGSNIQFKSANDRYTHINNKYILYNRNTFTVDFSDINAVLEEGSYAVIKVDLGDTVIEKEIDISDESSEVISNISVINFIDKYSGMVYIADLDLAEVCEVLSYKNLEFKISNTNAVEGEAVLYRYNYDAYSFEEYASKDISDLKKTISYGYAYNYDVTFENVPAGYIYYLQFGGRESNYVAVTDKPAIISPSYYNWLIYDDTAYFWMEYCGVDFDSDNISVYYINDSGKKVVLPSKFYVNSAVDGSVEVDLSSVGSFDYINLCFEKNGSLISTVTAYDASDKNYSLWTYTDADAEGKYIYINSESVVNVENPVLKVVNVDYYRYTPLFGSVAAEKNVDFGSNQYLKVDMSLLNLENGYYYAYLCDGDVPVSGYCEFYVNDSGSEEGLPIKLSSLDVSGGIAKVSVSNKTDGEYKDAVLAVAAYDAGGKLLKVTLSDISIDIFVNKTYSIPTVTNAAQYKAFVWNSKNNIKPIMK